MKRRPSTGVVAGKITPPDLCATGLEPCFPKRVLRFMEPEERKRELEAQLARCLALGNEDLSEVTKQNLRDLEADIRLELKRLLR